MGRILSVEFDKSSIKVVESSRKGDILSVLRCFSVDVATGIENGKINYVETVANSIKEGLIKNNVKTRKAVFVVNSDCVVTRNMRLPFLENGDDTLSMIRIQLSQLIPIDFNQYKIKYKIIDIVEENDVKEAFYVIYCIPGKLVQDLSELSKRMKMKVACLHISFCCLNNIADCNININGVFLDEKNTYAFIDINSQYISFCTLNKAVNDFSRISFYGQDEYSVEAVAESQYSYTEYSEDSLFFKYEVLNKINRCVNYYHSVDSSSSIDKLYLYGENSKVNNIGGFLSQKLEIEVEVINQIQKICFDTISLNDNLISSNYFIPVLSLFKGKSEMCFSTNERTEPVHRPKLLATVCGAIVLLSSYLGFKYYTGVSNKIYNMSMFIGNEDNVSRNEEIESLKEEIASLENYLEQSMKLKALISSEDFVSSVIFREIFNAIPHHTSVSAISADINGIQLSCFSESMEEVTLFLHNLREINFIDEIYLADIDVKQGESGRYSYSVMCKLKDVNGSVQ